MATYSSTESFFRDLLFYWLYAEDLPMFPGEWEEDCISDFVLEVRTTLAYFGESFNDEFHPIFKRSCSQVGTTDEEFFAYVIPRFLKICETPNYFNFMLACSFTCELVLYFATQKMCYRFMGSCHNCLTAVFNRGFDKTFKALGSLEGLRLFCVAHNKVVMDADHRESLLDILTEDCSQSKKEVSALIAACEHLDVSCPLTESELVLIHSDDFSPLDCIVWPVFSYLDIPIVCDPFQFEWNFKTEMRTIFLSTLVDFGTDNVYSTTIRRVVKTEEAETEVGESHQGDFEIDQDEIDSILTPYFKEKYDSLNLYSLIGTVFKPREIVYPRVLRRSSTDTDEEREDQLIHDFQDTVMELSKIYAMSKEAFTFFPRLMARNCRQCGQKCYLFGKYFFLKHRDLCASSFSEMEDEK